MSTTALTVIDRTTGELLDVRETEADRLARFDVEAVGLIAEINAARGVVSDELVRRLDQDANWTQRFGEPTGAIQYEVTAPSPKAGTTSYPVGPLERELKGLMERGTISAAGASKALVRTLVLVLAVPWDAEPDDLADQVANAKEIEVAGVKVEVVKAEGQRSAKLPGVNALRKVPGAVAALDRAKLTLGVNDRKAKVKVKTRADA